MNSTQESIQEYFSLKPNSWFKYEVCEDGDAKIFYQQYNGMLLSDIFLVNPGMIDWLITSEKTDKTLRMIAQQIKNDYQKFVPDVQRKILTGK